MTRLAFDIFIGGHQSFPSVMSGCDPIFTGSLLIFVVFCIRHIGDNGDRKYMLQKAGFRRRELVFGDAFRRKRPRKPRVGSL